MFQYLPESDTLFQDRYKNIMKYKYPLILAFHPVTRHTAQLSLSPLLTRYDVRVCFCMRRHGRVCYARLVCVCERARASFPGHERAVHTVKESSLL